MYVFIINARFERKIKEFIISIFVHIWKELLISENKNVIYKNIINKSCLKIYIL